MRPVQGDIECRPGGAERAPPKAGAGQAARASRLLPAPWPAASDGVAGRGMQFQQCLDAEAEDEAGRGADARALETPPQSAPLPSPVPALAASTPAQSSPGLSLSSSPSDPPPAAGAPAGCEGSDGQAPTPPGSTLSAADAPAALGAAFPVEAASAAWEAAAAASARRRQTGAQTGAPASAWLVPQGGVSMGPTGDAPRAAHVARTGRDAGAGEASLPTELSQPGSPSSFQSSLQALAQPPDSASLSLAASALSGALPMAMPLSAPSPPQPAQESLAFQGLLAPALSVEPSAATPELTASLGSHPAAPGFGPELGGHLRMMVRGGLARAQLHLVLPSLGPIQVRLSVREQVAQIELSAPHESTREGLARSIGGLRDMLAREGITLGEAHVGDGHSPRDPAGHARGGGPDGHRAPTAAADGRGRRPGDEPGGLGGSGVVDSAGAAGRGLAGTWPPGRRVGASGALLDLYA